jgi:H+/Cl- antiporter ClcA/CBS domain-containing protein
MTATHKSDYSTDKRLLSVALIATAIGFGSTGSAYVLLKLISFFTNLFFYQTLSFDAHSPASILLGAWVIVVPVVGGLLVGLIARFGTDKIRGHGIPEAIEAILFRKSKISPRVALLKPLASGIAIGSGGPFGAEGPIIMTGGAIGSLVAQYIHLSAAERKTLLVAGASAGMTAVFGTPLAAVLLAVELLLFEWRPRSFLPVVMACATAAFCRPFLMDAGPMFPVTTGPVSLMVLPGSVLAGLLCGVVSATLSAALYKVEDAFEKLPLHWMWWPVIGGLVVGIGGYLQPRALGVGYDVIGDLLHGHIVVAVALSLLLVKATIWFVALGSGTSGGVLAPLLMLGAGLGLVIAPLMPGTEAALWPLVCMAAILAGILGAPLTATAFALELSHDMNALLPMLLATSVTYGFSVLTQRRSIMTEKIARRGLHIYREYSVDPLERVNVGELMTRDVKKVIADETIAEVLAEHFGPNQIHRAFPVINDQGSVIGMLDRATLMGAMAADWKQPVKRFYGANPPVVALASETCRTAAGRMAVHQMERLPVVADSKSRLLVGIISHSDLIKSGQAVFEEEEQREKMRLIRLPIGFFRQR